MWRLAVFARRVEAPTPLEGPRARRRIARRLDPSGAIGARLVPPRHRVKRRSAPSGSTPDSTRHRDGREQDPPIPRSRPSGSPSDSARRLRPERRGRLPRLGPRHAPAAPARRCTFAARASAGRVSGDAGVDDRRRAGLLRLQPLPVREDLVGARHLHVAEHVRMPMDELRDQPSATSSTSQRPSSAAIWAWNTTWSRRSPSSSRISSDPPASIASSSSCVSSRRCRASVAWVCSWSQGQPSRPAEPRHHLHEVEQTLTLRRRRDRAVGTCGAASRSAVTVTPTSEGEAEASGSVLRLGSTENCSVEPPEARVDLDAELVGPLLEPRRNSSSASGSRTASSPPRTA